MKKKYIVRSMAVLTILAFLSMPSLAQAAGPYLVCDPYTASAGLTGFTLFFDGSTTGISVPVFTDATGSYIHYDLSTLANGSHTVVARAKNQWGESANSSPFTFVKQVPATPLNIRISTN